MNTNNPHYCHVRCSIKPSMKSSSCTHALTELQPTSFQLQPNVLPPTAPDDNDVESVPVTSLPCQWKPPKKRKESTLRISEAVFEKFEYEFSIDGNTFNSIAEHPAVT